MPHRCVFRDPADNPNDLDEQLDAKAPSEDEPDLLQAGYGVTRLQEHWYKRARVAVMIEPYYEVVDNEANQRESDVANGDGR